MTNLETTNLNTMMDTARQADGDVWADVARVCQRIPPLWDLPNYVAVNPFLGFAAQPLVSAATIIADGLGAEALPPSSHYRARWREGTFDLSDLTAAAQRSGADPFLLEKILDGEIEMNTRVAQPVLTHAERHDQQHGTSWNHFLIAGAARWCAVHNREGGAFAPETGQKAGLYDSWREAARADRSPEIAGLGGWRSWAGDLPMSAEHAISDMLVRLEVSPAERTPYLYRLLAGVYGWASFLRRSSWESAAEAPDLLLDLLAMRICGDAAVPVLAKMRRHVPEASRPQLVEDENTRLVLQEALENGFVRSLLTKIAGAPPAPHSARPAVQAVFCIDTRSEPLRRHLETASEAIETIGFAGFFGVSLNWEEGGKFSARCPVLLKPTARARPQSSGTAGTGKALTKALAKALAKALKHVQSAPASSFTFAELLGTAYGTGLTSDAFASIGPESFSLRSIPNWASAECTASFEFGGGVQGETSEKSQIDLGHQVDLAADILTNLGLRSRFGRLVFLCGHQGDSANNSHAASLDCGACGGHSGAINARVVAALLNEPAVRRALTGRGFSVPDDTHFMPGVHHTSTDEVVPLDADRVPPGHAPDLAQLRLWLMEAAEGTRQERAAALGLRKILPSTLNRALRRRAGDWSEVRPEWGLARNAAFIAARRARTRGVDLEGRAFLHEYDWTTDPDNSILSLILAAPMVVASWINLQYFASTVDNGT